MDDARTEELKQNLATVRERIDDAARAAGRSDRPELIVVTKYFPAADVRRLHSLGVRDIGENKDQEAAAKAAETAELEGLRRHFIGQLQTNKATSVVRYASAVHSVDRVKLVNALAKAHARFTEDRAAWGSGDVVPDMSRRAGGASGPDPDDRASADRVSGDWAPDAIDPDPLECLIQVDLREPLPEDHRGGAAPTEIPALAEAIASAEGLNLAGLMAVAPLEEDPGPAFERLATLHTGLHTDHPGAGMLSAGMSQDLEAAVACGTTHLRIGRDVLGERPYDR